MKTKPNKGLRDIDAPLFGYWRGLLYSFFSPAFYVDVAKRWRGVGILYLLLLVSVVTVLPAIKAMILFNQGFQEEILQPISALPSMYIKNGILHLDKPMPYFVRNAKRQVVMVIDTKSDKTWMNDPQYPDVTTVFKKKLILYRIPRVSLIHSQPILSKTEIYQKVLPTGTGGDGIFDGAKWLEMTHISRVPYVLAAFMYPAMVTFFFTMGLFSLLGFAMLGQVISYTIFKCTLTYPESARLLICSTTPAWFLNMILILLEGNFHYWKWGVLILAAIYFSFAVLCFKRSKGGLVLR
jgi:hypothetical protein